MRREEPRPAVVRRALRRVVWDERGQQDVGFGQHGGLRHGARDRPARRGEAIDVAVKGTADTQSRGHRERLDDAVLRGGAPDALRVGRA